MVGGGARRPRGRRRRDAGDHGAKGCTAHQLAVAMSSPSQYFVVRRGPQVAYPQRYLAQKAGSKFPNSRGCGTRRGGSTYSDIAPSVVPCRADARFAEAVVASRSRQTSTASVCVNSKRIAKDAMFVKSWELLLRSFDRAMRALDAGKAAAAKCGSRLVEEASNAPQLSPSFARLILRDEGLFVRLSRV